MAMATGMPPLMRMRKRIFNMENFLRAFQRWVISDSGRCSTV